MSDTKQNPGQDNGDAAAAAELDGVPESMKDGGEANVSQPENSDNRIEALENELAEAQQAVLYAQAETQNVRRRLEKDAQDARAYAATGFARDMLSVMDNMQRALEAIPAEVKDEEKWKGLINGIEATGRELQSVFEKNGIKRVASVGLPLDPNQHQAMVEIPTDEHEPGTIVQEMQAGYVIKDRLLRPAFVGVAKKAEE
ncbi:nucleotide exchange factor GrpE [Parasphingorhabdus flavimaris]|uniref:Protein GrpE n=1 Tax=Parasphingorhabdus flavimaris TaxID=266812 RepID=A0ABX2MZ53_9SPHN|nr:nucleotide exchange factor GrpE [Parasphingorhabdus flavimaris]NVD26735.1 nucleotide exchange factor GrpE [Parasphingorhabdus flavimaris]|tara:strand:+ start:20266 stop:20865 length:600 start_codon:yes stop_codon:yes gene_type:complete